MKYEIFIHSDPDDEMTVQDLEKVADATLTYLNAPEGDLTLVFTDVRTIQNLNRDFAGENRPTDVLSFSNGDTDTETGKIYYGDVVLSIPIAERQAKEAGHSLREELTLLIIHGVLHILGFDHLEKDDQQMMWSIQDEILSRLGSKIVSPR
jgi:probable rRNA maturation factor